MSLTDKDIADAIMEGEAMFKDWLAEYEAAQMEEKLRMIAALELALTPDYVKAFMAPGQLQQAEQLVGGRGDARPRSY